MAVFDKDFFIFLKYSFSLSLFPGNNWYRGACEDADGNIQETGKIYLGRFNDYDEDIGRKYDGRGVCYFNCQRFGLTGCEYHYISGDCSAHTKQLVRKF